MERIFAGASATSSSSSNYNNNSVEFRAQPVIGQMRNLMNKGEYYNAISTAEQILAASGPSSSTSPSSTNNQIMNPIEKERIYCLRAECYLSLKHFSKAEKEARAAILASESSSPQAQFILGCSLLGQFKIVESVDAFDVAESLMKSPQPWKYVILPNNNNNSNNDIISRQYRDVGLDEISRNSLNSNSSSSSSSSPLLLLPPPPVTYEWTNALNFWRSEAAMARKLYQAQNTRLLSSRSDLVQGIRMLEQYAKQSSSKFLIVTLRNDTDHDLIYQFHTCGSEAAAALIAKSNNKNNNSTSSSVQHVDPVTQSATQYLMKFPHTIPSNGVGVAIIYSDSWRAKTISLNSTVTFSIGKDEKKYSSSSSSSSSSSMSQISSPNIRFSFSLSSVMGNIGADVTIISPQSASRRNSKSAPTQLTSSIPSTASMFSYNRQVFTAFAYNRFPQEVYSRNQTSSGFSGTQSDVAKIPAVYLSIVQKLEGMKTPSSSNTKSNQFSTVLMGSIAQYLQARPLRLAAGISQHWRNVISSFPPSRFDDFPYSATFPDYSLSRDVRTSPFTIRIPQPLHHPADSNKSPPPNSVHWVVKREDTPMFRTLCFRNSRGDPILYFVGEPGKGNDYHIRLPGGVQGRCLLCRVTSTQGFFSSKRTADVFWVNNANYSGEPMDTESMTSVKNAKVIHRTMAGDEVQVISVHMKCLSDEQQQQQNQSAKSSSKSSSANQQQQQRDTNSNQEEYNLPGLELVAPKYSSLTRNNQNNSNLVTIRDISSKHVVATVEPLPNSVNDPQLRGSQVLRFFSQTDGLYCAMLCAEFLVAW